MKKVNVAKLLKDCPKGMELDSPVWDNIVFEELDDDNIVIFRKCCSSKVYLTQYGTLNDIDGKCVIFPKGKTTWEGFVPPYKFNYGDIVVNASNKDSNAFIYAGENDKYYKCYVGLATGTNPALLTDGSGSWVDKKSGIRPATEEEKEKLFQAIKDNGYKWNAETKALEKLIEPKFHEGDWVTDGVNKCQIRFIDDTTYYWYSENCILGSIESVDKRYHIWTINDAKDGDVLFHSDSASNGIFIFKEILQRGTIQKVICYCDYDSEDGFCLGENHTCCWTDSKILHPATKEQSDILFQKMKEAGYKWNAETKTLEKLIEPKFKVGDRIVEKNGITKPFTISQVGGGYYCSNDKNAVGIMRIEDQDKYELVPNKFDINTLIPFESKVLVRHDKDNKWTGSFFSFIDRDLNSHCYKFVTTADKSYPMMIPYKGNEYLLGKVEDCKDFYKIWE